MPQRARREYRGSRRRRRDCACGAPLCRADAVPANGLPDSPSIATKATGGTDDVRKLREWLRMPSTRNVLRIAAHVTNAVQLRGLQLQRTLHHHLQAGALRYDDLVAAREQLIDQCTSHAAETADRCSRTRTSAGRSPDDTA